MSSLLQIVGQTSGVSHLLKVDSNGKMGVTDSAVATALAGSLTVADSAVATALAGSLTVSDSTAQGSLSAIASSVGGTLSVSAPALSTTNSSLASAQSVASSTTFTSASQDLGGVKEFVILGSVTDSSAQIKTELSVDNSNWIENNEVSVYVNGGVFVAHQKSLARYVRFTYSNSSGVASTLTMDVSHKA